MRPSVQEKERGGKVEEGDRGEGRGDGRGEEREGKQKALTKLVLVTSSTQLPKPL